MRPTPSRSPANRIEHLDAASHPSQPGPRDDTPSHEPRYPYCDHVRGALLRARAAIDDAIARLPNAGSEEGGPTHPLRRQPNTRGDPTTPRHDETRPWEDGGHGRRGTSRAGKVVVDIRRGHRSVTFPDDRPTVTLHNRSVMLIDALNIRRGEIENSGALGYHETIGGHTAQALRIQLVKDFGRVRLPRRDVKRVVIPVRRKGMKGYLLADGVVVKGGTAGHTVSMRGAAPLSAAEGEDILRRHGNPYSSRRASRRARSSELDSD